MGTGAETAVELVAVRARQIAAARRDDLRDDRTVRPLKGAGQGSGLAEPPRQTGDAATEGDRAIRMRSCRPISVARAAAARRVLAITLAMSSNGWAGTAN